MAIYSHGRRLYPETKKPDGQKEKTTSTTENGLVMYLAMPKVTAEKPRISSVLWKKAGPVRKAHAWEDIFSPGHLSIVTVFDKTAMEMLPSTSPGTKMPEYMATEPGDDSVDGSALHSCKCLCSYCQTTQEPGNINKLEIVRKNVSSLSLSSN